MYESGEVDWGLAETLAYGSLLLEGRTVRLTGQDTRRGTFAHRHAALIDYHTEDVFVPLWHLAPDQGEFWVYDSSLSEYAAMGIEYGYATVARDTLVAWEAQFGDFVNGAQIIVDQFLAAADDKWAQRSGVVLLLPHGFEGQGPEHSSARIERFLTLCAEGNLTVANATTAAQFFHLLRRQVSQGNQRPLVVFTPKSGLRSRSSRSPIEDLTSPGAFREVLDDDGADAAAVRTVVLCSGKIAYDAVTARDRDGLDAAIVRIEQIYPWPAPILAGVMARYPAAQRLVWLQEEPLNMGAALFVTARAELPDLPVHGHRPSRVGQPGHRHAGRAPAGAGRPDGPDGCGVPGLIPTAPGRDACSAHAEADRRLEGVEGLLEPPALMAIMPSAAAGLQFTPRSST